MHAKALLGALVMILTVLAGCAGDAPEPKDDADVVVPGITPVLDRAGLPFDVTDDVMSHTLVQGVYDILDPVSVVVDIDLPATEGGAATDPTTSPKVHLGVIFPDIPGCDFDAIRAESIVEYEFDESGVARLNDTDCQVPVVADAGPYWGESDVPADERGSGRLGETLIQNLVPHGYAVAQISVFGSGKSNHCFDMFGDAEQLGVAGAVEWLGGQSWSNGNVGLIGRSYDGSTPWMAAAHAPEALKTIVPISGLSGLGDLVTWNGASETRVALFQNFIYAQFGLTPRAEPGFASEVAHRATCPDWVSSTAWGAEGYAAGGEMAEGDYWEERNFVPEVVQNYEGSVYLIHGLRDDNVDPHAGWLAHRAMIEKGLETKGLYGQWYHSYPDRWTEHGESGPSNSVRFDWAQDLLEWFDYYLKGSDAKPELHIEVQQADGQWRLDDGLEPSNATVLEIPVQGTGTIEPLGPDLIVDLGVIDETNDTILGGLSELDIYLAPSGPAGQVYIELFDMTDGGTWGLSYGITRLDRAVAGPELPGVAGVYTIPLQYFAGSLPAGHHLGLRVAGSGNDYLPSPDLSPIGFGGTGSVLRLSTIPDPVFFEVPVRETA